MDIREHLPRFCGGDDDAVRLIVDFWSHCETWDDLVDKDKDVPESAINAMMVWAMFELPANRVYRENPSLALVLRLVISNWAASNRLSKSERYGDKVTAYTLRCAPYDFFTAVIMCVSGPALADEAAFLLRSCDSGESLEMYLSERGA